MYLINKDETEHTGQVRRNSSLVTLSEEPSAAQKQRNCYFSVTVRDTVCRRFKGNTELHFFLAILLFRFIILFYIQIEFDPLD